MIIIDLPLVILGIEETVKATLITWASISIVIGLWLLYKLGG